MTILLYIFAISLIGAVTGQDDSVLSNLPDNVRSQIPQELNQTQVQDAINKTKDLFKKKCLTNADLNAYTRAESAQKELENCLKKLVDTNQLQDEIENAKPNGEVDEVFAKYCNKTPEFKDCFRNMTEAVKPCLEPEERKNLVTVHNITEQMAEFICYKGGDRLALFIGEHGPECFDSKQEEIKQCINETIGADINITALTDLSIENLPKLEFTEKECNKMDNLQQCVVYSLNSCVQPTTANIVESLFKFVRKATPCKEFKFEPAFATTQKPVNSVNGMVITTGMIYVGIVTILL